MNKIEIGTWAEIPTSYTIHIMSKAGFDFSIADFEHGSLDMQTVQNMVFAAHAANAKLYVRVPEITEAWILRVLDTGCDGLIFPQIHSVDQVKQVLKYSCFPPMGSRGFNPYITAGNYGKVSGSYFLDENNRIKLGVILENKAIIEDLDSVLDLNVHGRGIDIFYIGQYDLSVDMGIPGDVTNPKLLTVMENAVKKINLANKIAGCMVHSVEECKQAIKQGFAYIVYKVDAGLLFTVVNNFIEEVKKNESM